MLKHFFIRIGRGGRAALAGALLGSLAGCVSMEDAGEPPPAPVIVRGTRPPPVRGTPPAVRPPTNAPAAGRRPPAPFPPPARPAPVRPPAQDPAGLSAQDTLALQVLLDRKNFSPGCVDGLFDERTRAALSAWQEHEGLPVTGRFTADLWGRLGRRDNVLATYTVTAEDVAGLAEIPEDWPGRAVLPQMGFETVLELVAEKHHAAESLVREMNPGLDWPNPRAGATVAVPNPRPYRRTEAGRIEISLGAKTVRVLDADGRLAAYFPCSIARDKEKRPVGELHIATAAADPNYTFDPALFYANPADHGLGNRLLIPPGPNNPVGAAWLGLDRPGYGIHGTPRPDEIGEAASHGCFRLANWNARKLLAMVRIGTPVLVRE
jgi:lipoprotein-anchoring transpeptidase ErfK/SrfK